MPRLRRAASACLPLALALLCACNGRLRPGAGPSPFIDLRFSVGKGADHFPHAIDNEGALWYVEGDRIVRATAPSRRTVALRDADAGALFWYDGYTYVIGNDGTSLTRIGKRLKVTALTVPDPYAPVEGAVADSEERWIVLTREHGDGIAVVDVWRWYREPMPRDVTPFAMALAGGPHGKKYLIAGDEHDALLAVENRRNHRWVSVNLPDNECFSGSATWRVPVDVHGRDDYRSWAISGQHVASIDLSTKRVLRVWDLDGCATNILAADANAVRVLVSDRNASGFTSSVVRIDRDGVHALDSYGQIDGLAGGAMLDRFGRLWWYDARDRAFVCRTPLQST